MKKKYNIYIAILLVFSIVSCDDFLDIKPKGKVIPQTYEQFRDVLKSAYYKIPEDKAKLSMRGDEFILNEDDWGKSYQNIYLWNEVNASGVDEAMPWKLIYECILDANQVLIDGEHATNGGKEELAQLRAEAFFMRAYMHFNLANIYADVYSKANLGKKAFAISTTIDIWKDYARNTVGEVYAQIESDINAGLKLMNVDEPEKGYNYRFSKVSAYGLASRFYLSRGEWGKAQSYAKKAYDINNQLEDLNQADAQVPQHFKSKENVWALDKVYTSWLGSNFLLSKKLVNMYDKDNDLRLAKFFKEKNAGKGDYVCVFKGNEYRVSMRTAEFYLVLAETNAQLGKLAEARTYLKGLVEKRFKTDYFTNTLKAKIDGADKNTLLSMIKEERMRELACQGLRWFDLRRYGKPQLEKTYKGKKYILKKGDVRYVVPFPKEAIDANPNLLN